MTKIQRRTLFRLTLLVLSLSGATAVTYAAKGGNGGGGGKPGVGGGVGGDPPAVLTEDPALIHNINTNRNGDPVLVVSNADGSVKQTLLDSRGGHPEFVPDTDPDAGSIVCAYENILARVDYAIDP